MKRKYLVMLFLSFLILLSACQPTPETAPVQGKSGSLIDMISGNYEYEPENAAALNGQTWSETVFEEEGIHIIVDAKIITQDVKGYPVVRVKSDTEKLLTSAFLQKSIGYFFDGCQPYYRTLQPIKKECEMQIIWYQQMISTGLVKDDMMDSANQSLEYYKNAYIEAAEYIPFDIETDPYGEKFMKDTGMEDVISLVAFPADGLMGILVKNNYVRFNRINSLSYYYEYEVGLSSFDDVPKSVTMDTKAALKIAEESVNIIAAGDDMKLARVATTNNASMYETDFSEFQDLEPRCLVFYFMRSFGGVEPNYIVQAAKTFNTNEADIQFRPGVDPDYIRVVVDDMKIVDWTWNHPDLIVGVMSQDVPLMPFEQIKDIFRQQVNYYYSYHAWPSSKETIKIDKIVLSLMKIDEKDNNEASLVIPVWDFIGTQDSVFFGIKDGGDADYSFLTINAIDGSSIDRSVGY